MTQPTPDPLEPTRPHDAFWNAARSRVLSSAPLTEEMLADSIEQMRRAPIVRQPAVILTSQATIDKGRAAAATWERRREEASVELARLRRWRLIRRWKAMRAYITADRSARALRGTFGYDR